MTSYDATGSGATPRVRDLVAAASADTELDGVAAELQRVCRAAADALPVDGAVVHLMSGDEDVGVAASSTTRWRPIADLVFTTGEGPCLDAARWHRPVLVPDVQVAALRWPGYAGAVQEHEVSAVFAFPMQAGAVGVGVLDLYAAAPGTLGGDDLALALAFARIATEMLLDGQVRNRRPKTVADLEVPLNRAEIHQAQGMVMVALGITLAEALIRMRARAFADDIPLADLARAVISGAVKPQSWGVGHE